jgi:hypothetical protein
VFQPLTTERLIIRQARFEDALALCERRTDPLVAEYQGSQMDGTATEDYSMATVTTPEGEILGDLAVRLEWEGRAAEIG